MRFGLVRFHCSCSVIRRTNTFRVICFPLMLVKTAVSKTFPPKPFLPSLYHTKMDKNAFLTLSTHAQRVTVIKCVCVA